MIIKNNKSTIHFKKSKDLNKTPILFLHGFSGSSDSWINVRKNIQFPSIAIDIPGHGKSYFNNIDESYDYKDFRSELYLILQQINVKRIHLCGYSMGGRLAISFAQKYPEMIESLILESSSLGIVNQEEKEVYLDKDKEKAFDIISSLQSFINKWQISDIFKHQKERNKEEYLRQNSIRLSHKPEQLSKSLIAFSKGNMPAYHDAFCLFDFPIYLINGHDDTKYIKFNRDMMKINKTSKQFIINNASHNTHLENQEMFIKSIIDILS